MAERQQDLGKTPDKSLEPTLSAADKLILADSARQGFLRALEDAGTIKNDFYRQDSIVHIGKMLARSNLDPSEVVTQLVGIARTPNQPYSQNIWEGVAQIYAKVGRDISLAPTYKSDNKFYLNLARTKARYGQNPSPELSRVYRRIKESEPSSIEPYADLAVAQFQIKGVYPESLLSTSEANLEEYAKNHAEEKQLANKYAVVAKAYASCGKFEKSLQLVDKVKVQDMTHEVITKIQILEHISEEQRTEGLYQDAIQTAKKALSIIELIEDQPTRSRYQTVEAAHLHAFIGAVQAYNGEDPTLSFKLAANKVDETPFGYYKMMELVDIAGAKEAVGINASNELEMAREELDRMPEDWDYDYHHEGRLQIMGYEELASTQIELGYIQEAEDTLASLQNLRSIGDEVKYAIVKIQVNIAAAKASRGLTQEEINVLNPEFVQAVKDSLQTV